jgi:membrane-bound lytic murein transglycosylase D
LDDTLRRACRRPTRPIATLIGRLGAALTLAAVAAGCATVSAPVAETPAAAASIAASANLSTAASAAADSRAETAARPDANDPAPRAESVAARSPGSGDALTALVALHGDAAPHAAALPPATLHATPTPAHDAAPAASTPRAAPPDLPYAAAAPAAAVPAALPEPPAAPGDLWERIRRGFAIPDLETKLAANRTQWYASQPDYIDRMAQRASLYLFHIVEEIEKRGLPTELALLPFVESAMQPEAVSSAKAAGLWQFIPSTGKIYALEQNHWQDQRRDVVESTRAALDYLQKLYADFGDWHLALAAYNWGEGAVGRAISRNRAQRKSTDYTSLRMPRETQYYVPKLQAIENIVRDPARYGITLPQVHDEPYFVAVSKERDIDVETAARLAEMPLDQFRALNPSFSRPVIVGAAQPTLLLPAARAETFKANLAAWEATGQPLASWTTYTLQPGETLAQVAQRADISEAKLREANRVPPRYRLASGSTILVPRDDSADEDIAPQHLDAAFKLVPEAPNLRQITYRVRRGDTLSSVSRRFGVQPDEIVAWNHLRSPALFAGQRLTLTVVRGAAGPTNPRPSTRSKATAKPASAAGPASKPATAAAKPTALRPTAATPQRTTATVAGRSGRARAGTRP